jgi:hypothetical protein
MPSDTISFIYTVESVPSVRSFAETVKPVKVAESEQHIGSLKS